MASEKMSSAEGWQRATVEHLKVAERLKKAEQRIGALERELKRRAPKPESDRSFRKRVLNALGA